MYQRTSAAVRFLIILVAVLFAAFPTYWMIITSLKSEGEVFSRPPTFWPELPTLASYVKIFTTTKIIRALGNSMFVSVATTMVAVVLGAMAAYGFTRFFKRGENVFVLVLLIVRMLPDTLLIIPVFKMAAAAGAINNYASLIIALSTFALPFAIWILIGFMRTIPTELDEAASIDGAGPVRTFISVIVPISAPGLFAVGLSTFLLAWNAYLWPLILTTSEENYTAPVLIAGMAGSQFQVNWSGLMAASVLAAVPVLILFALLERSFLRGFTAGAVKG